MENTSITELQGALPKIQLQAADKDKSASKIVEMTNSEVTDLKLDKTMSLEQVYTKFVGLLANALYIEVDKIDGDEKFVDMGDVFRRDLGNLSDAYTEVARRLGVMPKTAGPITKPTLIN